MNARRIHLAPDAMVNSAPGATGRVPERRPKDFCRGKRIVDRVKYGIDKLQRREFLQLRREQRAHLPRKLRLLHLERLQRHDVRIVVRGRQRDAQQLREPCEHDHRRSAAAPVFDECKPRTVDVVEQAHRRVVLRHLYAARASRPADICPPGKGKWRCRGGSKSPMLEGKCIELP
jgi:hypothetical protein